MDANRCCGTCIHHKPVIQNGFLTWVCENENAEAYAFETEYKDTCVDYEERN